MTYTLTEGTTTILTAAPASDKKKGPGTRTSSPFYNPSMEQSRDLSVLVNQWLITTLNKPLTICDGLAASGARGIRLAHELTGDIHVTINDAKPASYQLIQDNIQTNHLTNTTATNQDLNVLLSQRRFHSIDIDPFGSPITFLDSTMRSIQPRGLIAITATDTAPLCGVFPQVCRRRYDATPLHGPCMHETGLRILLGVLAREAAKYDKGIQPILTYTTDHYFRAYAIVHYGKHRANDSINHHTTIPSDQIPLAPISTEMIGPLWMGPLHHKRTIQEIRSLLSTKTLNTRPSLWKLLNTLEDEADAPAFYYTMEDIASRLKHSMPPIHTIIHSLQKDNYFASRTHFTPTGIKTNTPWETIHHLIETVPEH